MTAFLGFLRGEQAFESLGVHCRRTQEALEFLAPGGRQEGSLRLGFHALGNDP
jgi:hypothetical protein